MFGEAPRFRRKRGAFFKFTENNNVFVKFMIVSVLMYSQEVIVMKGRELLEEYQALLDRDTVLHMEQNMSPAGYEEIDIIHLRQLQLPRP